MEAKLKLNWKLQFRVNNGPWTDSYGMVFNTRKVARSHAKGLTAVFGRKVQPYRVIKVILP